jgi:hypothetical protein
MIWIFGDSFAANCQPTSWSEMIGDVNNYASNGSSEYRILKSYRQFKNQISNLDKVIFVHTSPSRIYLKDDKKSLSRTLETYKKCDIIINDIFEKKEKEYINILESIWDDEYFNDIFMLIVSELKLVPNSFHITFFDSSIDGVLNLNHLWKQYPGNINHLSVEGNLEVSKIICSNTYTS